MAYPHTYAEAGALLRGRNAQSRKLGNNTYLQRALNDIEVLLWGHAILRFHPDGNIILDSCGYRTVTTKDRMNAVLHPGFTIFSEKGVWYLHKMGGDGPNHHWDGGQDYPFADGMLIRPDGTVEGAAVSNENKLLRKAISKYAAACADALPLPLPGPGDCFYCYMHEEKSGLPFGEATHTTDHLLMHIEESYVVPSLVYRALSIRGSKASMWGAFPETTGVDKDTFQKMSVNDYMLEHARSMVKRTVRRYVLQQFGYQV